MLRADYSDTVSIPALQINLCIANKPSKLLQNAFEEANSPSKSQGPQQSTDLELVVVWAAVENQATKSEDISS